MDRAALGLPCLVGKRRDGRNEAKHRGDECSVHRWRYSAKLNELIEYVNSIRYHQRSMRDGLVGLTSTPAGTAQGRSPASGGVERVGWDIDDCDGRARSAACARRPSGRRGKDVEWPSKEHATD